MTSHRRNQNRPKLLAVLWLIIIASALVNNSPHRFAPLITGLTAGLGGMTAMQLANLWHLLSSRLVGFSVLWLSIGSGSRIAQRRVGGMPVNLRWLLVTPLIANMAPVRRPAQKLRLWLSMLLLSALELGLGLWLVADAGPGRAFGGGMLIMAVMALTLGAVSPLTPGWVLFRLPFMPADALDPYALTPAELAATVALRDGRVAEARTALDDSAPGFQTHLLRATIAVAEGRYTDASTESRLAVETAPHPKTAAPAYFLRAAALVGAAENGELPPAEYLPWLDQAVAAGQTASAVLARMVSPVADLALLEGRPDDALKLARKAARQGLDPFWQAQGECTYAAALAANGRPDEARAALKRARKLMPELARIEAIAARIGLGDVTAGR